MHFCKNVTSQSKLFGIFTSTTSPSSSHADFALGHSIDKDDGSSDDSTNHSDCNSIIYSDHSDATDSTAIANNLSPEVLAAMIKHQRSGGALAARLEICEKELSATRAELRNEETAKRKLYGSLMKLANELRKAKTDSSLTNTQLLFSNQEKHIIPVRPNGIWGSCRLLPDLIDFSLSRRLRQEHEDMQHIALNTTTSTSPGKTLNEDYRTQLVSLPSNTLSNTNISYTSTIDIFFHLVIALAFSRVGSTIVLRSEISDNNASSSPAIDLYALTSFTVIWLIWSKEASYTSRFDSRIDGLSFFFTLSTSLAVLLATFTMQDNNSCIMSMAAFVSIIDFCRHARVLHTYRHISLAALEPAPEPLSLLPSLQTKEPQRHSALDAQHYAIYVMVMTSAESIIWLYGVNILPNISNQNSIWLVFGVGIALGIRCPKPFIANNFYAAKHKRTQLSSLLVGVVLQNIMAFASAFFHNEKPDSQQYCFLGGICLLLISILLLIRADDTCSNLSNPWDHALLVSRTTAFLFYLGNFSLFFSMVVLGAGLDRLIRNYLSFATLGLSSIQFLVCEGFLGVVLSVTFIKSLHIRTVPVDTSGKQMLRLAHFIFTTVTAVIAVIVATFCFSDLEPLVKFGQSDIKLVFALAGASLILVIMSFIDEAIVLALYRESRTNSNGKMYLYRIHPLCFWLSSCKDSQKFKMEVAISTASVVKNNVVINAEMETQEDQLALLGTSNGRQHVLENEHKGYDSTTNRTSDKVSNSSSPSDISRNKERKKSSKRSGANNYTQMPAFSSLVSAIPCSIEEESSY